MYNVLNVTLVDEILNVKMGGIIYDNEAKRDTVIVAYEHFPVTDA